MRSGKTARNYHAAFCLAATLHWLNTGFINTPEEQNTTATAVLGRRSSPPESSSRDLDWKMRHTLDGMVGSAWEARQASVRL